MGRWRYGVILDAGSSGTRVHIYKWLNSARAFADATKEQLSSLPALRTKKHWTKKTHPGVSTFGDTPDLVGPDHLAPLFEHALSIVPKNEVENTPIFLLATAGMRLLPQQKRNALLQRICAYARKTTQFQLPDCDLHIQVIPGETEGLYGWIAANYLLGGFDAPETHNHGKDHHTYGFLDMGGASAQIAFAPNATEAQKHANDLKLLRLRTIGGAPMEYKVFVTTWLGYGVNEARRRYVEALVDAHGRDERELPDACLPKGLKVTKAGKPILPGSEEAEDNRQYLLGTGRFAECLSRTFPLLDKDAPCLDEPCLFHGSHVPAIDYDVNHFVGVSEYWHTTHEVFEMSHKDKAYDFRTYQNRVNQFCSQPWDAIQDGVNKHTWGKKVDGTTALEVCFKASWLINMLHEGIGIPRVGLEEMNGSHNGTKEVLDHAKQKGFLDPFQAVNKIDDVEVSWTLGKMVLYASSQIPAADGALAVGFGSNKPGIPADFQYAGGKYVPLPDDLTDNSGDDWHDALFQDSPRRIPGFLIFMLILCLAAFLLCGRDRRRSLLARLRRLVSGRGGPGSPRRRRGLQPGKRPGASPTYERVLEEGGLPDEFELADLDSDVSDTLSDGGGSRKGRTSGWATPQLKQPPPPPPGPGYFDGIVNQASGLGLGPPAVFSNAMERGGLMARTESRERLAPLGNRSRTASPNRMRSPMMVVKEAAD